MNDRIALMWHLVERLTLLVEEYEQENGYEEVAFHWRRMCAAREFYAALAAERATEGERFAEVASAVAEVIACELQAPQQRYRAGSYEPAINRAIAIAQELLGQHAEQLLEQAHDNPTLLAEMEANGMYVALLRDTERK